MTAATSTAGTSGTAARLHAGELGTMAVEGMRELLTRSLRGLPVAEYVEQRPVAWSVLREGGWDELGVREEDGGAGAGLVDLAEVAIAWGEFCVPAPLVGTLVAKRWSATARAYDGPVGVAVAVPALGGAALAPFGAEAGVRVLAGLDDGPDTFLDEAAGEVDGFTPSLRPAEIGTATRIGPGPAHELAVLWAAEGVGCARRCLADAVAYAKERRQFGTPIGSFQAIKHQLARMLELAERAETAVRWAATTGHHDGRITTRALALHALLTAQDVIERAVQVHGGMGFTWEMGVHVFLRHAITLRELVEGLDTCP